MMYSKSIYLKLLYSIFGLSIKGISKDLVIISLVLLSLTFTPIHSDRLNLLRVVSAFLGLLIFSFSLTLTGWVLNNNILMRYSKMLAFLTLLTTSSLVLTALSLSSHYLIYLSQVFTAITLTTFLLLYTYSYYVFRKTFKSARKLLLTVTSLTIIAILITATYLLPMLILTFIGVEPPNSYSYYLRCYHLISLAAFPALLINSLLLLTLPDF